MNYLKSHITLILALISILISIFLFRMFNKIVNLYEKNIVNNYSIVIVSTLPIESLPFDEIDSVESIDVKSQIKELQKKYPNIDFSKISFPHFYKLKLKSLINPEKLALLEEKLKNKGYIKRVLTHSSTQTKIYNLLTLLKLTTKVFMFCSFILGTMLIIKQLEVWKLIHSERMYIMELFGAPFWIKGASLFKIAIIDSFFAILIVAGIIYVTGKSILFNTILKELSINFSLNYFSELALLCLISFAISLVSSIIVVVYNK